MVVLFALASGISTAALIGHDHTHASGDPLVTGLVKSVGRPEGNTTGISGAFFSLGQKRVQLLKEAAPSIERVAYLYNPALVPQLGRFLTSIEEAAQAFAVQAISIPYSNASDIERAIDAFAAVPNGGLIFEGTGFSGDNRQFYLGLAKKYRLPAIYPNRNYVADGGLMSHSSNQDEWVRHLSSHVDRILRGAKPGDLPVEYPTRFQSDQDERCRGEPPPHAGEPRGCQRRSI
jgi:putative ABC transport system substrate-binding protein